MSQIIDVLGPLFAKRHDDIEAWFKKAYNVTQPLYYTSVDLRHSGIKIAPVDTNLFPAGFNNLSLHATERASEQTKEYFKKYCAGTKRVVIIPENHTRNLYYLENVYALQNIIHNAGYEVKLGSLETREVTTLTTQAGHSITLEPLSRKDNILSCGNGFTPETIIVNNDLTSGAPEILSNLEQFVLPPVGLGWYRRRKTTHFDTYAHVVGEFSHAFDIDPWRLSTIFHKCGKVSFKDKQGLECVALGVEKVLRAVRAKYQEHGITEQPYVFVKADSGTYGMGIMVVRSGEEILAINKKDRNKMSVIKEGTVNTEVIIQEGVPTIDKIAGETAEPMIYLIGGESVGCSFRVNKNRDAYGNLNAPGMTFKLACETDEEKGENSTPLCPVQCVIARLAALAAARECYEQKWDI